MIQNKKIFIKTIVSFVGTGLVAFALLFFAGVSTIKAANPTIQFTATSSSAAESVTPAILELTLSVATGSDATVDYALTGTATGGGVDYTANATGTATISAGNTTTTVSIVIVNDTLDENNETIIVTISNPANATLGTNTVYTYTINDNDTAPTIQFTATSSSAAESVTPVSLEFVSSAVSGLDVSVDYALTGTATGGGVDYTANATGTATISAGNTTTTVSIVIVNDTLDENNETIIVTISNPANATLGTNTVYTYTINDNDTAPTIQFTATSSSAAESVTPVSLEFVSSAVSGLDVSVDYALTGTATGGGVDYTANATGTATISAGNTTTTVSIVIVNDTFEENNETIIVTISNPANATLGTNTVYTYTINNNDTYYSGGGSIPSTPITATGQVTATPSAGGKTTLTTSAGTTATVELPAGAVTFNTVITIQEAVTGTIVIGAPIPTGQTIISGFTVTTTVDGTAVTSSFLKSVTITVTYTDAQVAGIDESSLKLYRWNGTQWVALICTINTTTNTITATTTSFSKFAVMTSTSTTSAVKPLSEMSIAELQTEIARITALITQLQTQIAQLQGGVSISLCVGTTFSRNLSQEMTGNDVKCLQSILNQSTDTRVAALGVGSSGYETTYFGALTKAAVIKFQEKYKSEILTPVGLSAGTGFVGLSTRAKLNALLGK